MKILVAIDSSAVSRRVLQEVAARPWPAGTVVCVATSVEVTQFVKFPVLTEGLKREAEELVATGVGTLTGAKLTAVSQVLVGNPRKSISVYAAQWGADVIFTGSHGQNAIGRFLLGSVAQGILRTAMCSVEIVRFPSGSPPPSSHPMKILLATDGSPCSLAAANAVAARPWPAGTLFRAFSVEDLIVAESPMAAYTPASIFPASLLEELLADARTRAVLALDDVRAILAAAGLQVLDSPPRPPADPRAAILDCAQSWPADLVLLGSHGRRGLDRLLMGSVAESVAVHGHCSVEVVRSKAFQ